MDNIINNNPELSYLRNYLPHKEEPWVPVPVLIKKDAAKKYAGFVPVEIPVRICEDQGWSKPAVRLFDIRVISGGMNVYQAARKAGLSTVKMLDVVNYSMTWIHKYKELLGEEFKLIFTPETRKDKDGEKYLAEYCRNDNGEAMTVKLHPILLDLASNKIRGDILCSLMRLSTTKILIDMIFISCLLYPEITNDGELTESIIRFISSGGYDRLGSVKDIDMVIDIVSEQNEYDLEARSDLLLGLSRLRTRKAMDKIKNDISRSIGHTALFAIFVARDGKIYLSSSPDRYTEEELWHCDYAKGEGTSYCGGIGGGGHRHKVEFTQVITKEGEVKIDIDVAFRGVIFKDADESDGFIRIDPPLYDRERFLRVATGRNDVGSNEKEMYNRCVIEQLKSCSRVLIGVVNPGKEFVIYDSLKELLKNEGYDLPAALTIGGFNDLINCEKPGDKIGTRDNKVGRKEDLVEEIFSADHTRYRIVIASHLGLHVRVAEAIIGLVSASGNQVTISKRDKTANAQSLQDLVKLAAEEGDTITIEVTGKNSMELSVRIEELLKDNSLLTNLGSGNINQYGERNTKTYPARLTEATSYSDGSSSNLKYYLSGNGAVIVEKTKSGKVADTETILGKISVLKSLASRAPPFDSNNPASQSFQVLIDDIVRHETIELKTGSHQLACQSSYEYFKVHRNELYNLLDAVVLFGVCLDGYYLKRLAVIKEGNGIESLPDNNLRVSAPIWIKDGFISKYKSFKEIVIPAVFIEDLGSSHSGNIKGIYDMKLWDRRFVSKTLRSGGLEMTLASQNMEPRVKKILNWIYGMSNLYSHSELWGKKVKLIVSADTGRCDGGKQSIAEYVYDKDGDVVVKIHPLLLELERNKVNDTLLGAIFFYLFIGCLIEKRYADKKSLFGSVIDSLLQDPYFGLSYNKDVMKFVDYLSIDPGSFFGAEDDWLLLLREGVEKRNRQRMLDKLGSDADRSLDKTILFAIFVEKNGKLHLSSDPNKYESETLWLADYSGGGVATYQGGIGLGGHRHKTEFTEVKIVDGSVTIDIDVAFRGTIDQSPGDSSGFIRIDPPLYDKNKFLMAVLEKKDITAEDSRKYDLYVVENLVSCVNVLSEVINPGKELILYASIKMVLKNAGYKIPDKLTFGSFVRMVNTEKRIIPICADGNVKPKNIAKAVEAEIFENNHAKYQIAITSRLGLHMRVASSIVDTVKRSKSSVTISKGGEIANGGSLKDLVRLAAGDGDSVVIEAIGEDALNVAVTVEELLKDESILTNLGSGNINRMEPEKNTQVETNNAVCSPQDLEKTIKRFLDNTEDNKESDFIGDSMLYMWLYREGGLLKIQACRDSVLGLLKEISILLEQFNSDQLIRLKERLRRLTIAKDVTVDDEEEITKLADYAEVRETAKNLLIRVDSLLEKNTRSFPDTVTEVPPELAWFGAVDMGKTVVRGEDDFEIDRQAAENLGCYQERFEKIIGLVSHFIKGPPLEVNIVIEPVRTGDPSIWYELDSNTVHIQVILLDYSTPSEYVCLAVYHDFVSHAYLKQDETAATRTTLYFLLDLPGFTENISGFLKRDKNFQIRDAVLDNLLSGKILPEFIELARVKDLKAGDNRRGRVDAPYLKYLLMKLGNCPEELEEMAVGMFEEYPELWQYLSRDENGLTVSEKRIRERISRKPVVLDDRQKDRINRILSEVRNFSNRDFSFERLQKKVIELISYRGESAEMVHDAVYNAINGMSEAMSGNRKEDGKVLGLAGQISGLYEIAVKRGTTLEKISLGSLECANKIVYGRDKTAIKEFDAVNSRAVFEFKFHLTLRKLFQQVIGADSARLSHLEVLTEYPEFKQIRNLVYFGEADDGYVTEALNAFIEDRPEIAPRVFVTESGISVKLTLQEVKEFLGSSITLDLAREEEKSCHKKFFAGDFRRRRIYMQKMIDRKLEALAGEKFDVIIAISNAPEWQLRKAWDIVDGFKYAGCYGIPYDLGLEPAAALKDKILGLLDTPKTGRELIRLLGVNSPDETILVYRICKSSAEIRTVFSGEHYVRMEKVRGEVIPELCPSALNSFLDYEIIGKPGDKAVEARLESLGIERLMISCEKGALIRDLAQKMLDSCCPDGRVVLFISGDVPYGMSCGWRRFGADAGAVDLHILAVVDESAFKQSPVPEIGRMLSDMERLLLTKIREKSDYAIIPLAKIYRYQDRINPDDAIAVKVISESNLLCGNTELYAEVKDAVKKGIWHNIPKLFFECAWESRADLMRRVIESPAAEWDLETREEFFDEACKGPSGLISFILAADVAGFAAGIENPDSARIFERYAEGLRYLEEYLASSGKFTGPPAEVPVAYYSKISERIVFNIAGKEALNILGSKGFSYEESRGIWSFIRGHEEYHQKYPYYSEKEVLAAQRRDLEGDEGISGSDGFIFKRWDKDPQCVAKGQFGKLEEVRDYPQSPFFDEANLPADYTGKINACLASAKKKILAEGIFKEDDFDITVSVVYPAYKSATFRRAKGDKYEIFLDRRCFANSDFLYLAVKHELTDIKIQKLVPEIDPALRELFTLVYVNVDGAMKLRNEHPIKAGGLLKYLRKVANTRIGLFARYEKILANPALNDPSYFIRDICRMLADETVYFKNMRRRAEVLLEGQSFRFNILRARLDILNKKLVESGHLTGGIDFEPLSAFLGGMPQALKVFARYAGSVQYLMEDGKVFLKVNFRNERGEMRFAYIYLGRNDNVELTLGRGGRIFSLSYEDWKKENPGIFYYKYDDMEKEKRVAWGNLKRIPLTQMINKISQYNIARGSRDVGKQLRELFEKLFEEMKLDCPLSSKTWLYLERRIGRNKAPGVYYVIRNQFINDYLNKIFPMILLGEVNVSNAPIKDLEIWPVMERGDMNPSLLRWLSTNKVRGAPLCYREADKISISGLLGILSASVPGQLSLFPGEQPFGGSRRERNHYPLPVSADSRKEAEINFGKNRILADINIDNFDIPCSEPVLAGSSQTLQQLLNTLGLLLGRAPPAVRVVELPATSKAELPELSSWNLVISTDLSLTEGNVAACNIDTKTVYLHPYFFELPESKQLEILYHELISHITKGIRNEEEAMRDTEDFFKIKSLAINVPALVSFHSQFQSLVDQNRIGQDTPEGYRISLRELIRVADFLKHHKN
ncbi:MAG: HPr family phosphocarrier protein, partial [Candidatus Omnitrophota bacterium]